MWLLLAVVILLESIMFFSARSASGFYGMITNIDDNFNNLRKKLND